MAKLLHRLADTLLGPLDREPETHPMQPQPVMPLRPAFESPPPAEPRNPRLRSRMTQIKLMFPQGCGAQYRFQWEDFTWSPWWSAPDGILSVPPAARGVEWRAK